MQRYLHPAAQADLARKMVFLTGPRQVGKTTLAKALMAGHAQAQYLNWDVPADQRVMAAQSWSPRSRLLVLDELHKMNGWKPYLKGVFDGMAQGQQVLVTGSARLDTVRQSGDSLAGRFFALRLHPISVAEWCRMEDAAPQTALDRLLERGGFPEPFFAEQPHDAERWRQAYLEGLVHEDVLEFSRIHEVRALRLFVQLLRERVGSTLSLASMARDMQISPSTATKYLNILEALYIVFTIRPYHANIARALLKEPKVYFFDCALVPDEAARFENACAAMLLKHVHYLQDVQGRPLALNFVRDKEGREIDFVLSENGEPLGLAECKLTNANLSPYLVAMAAQFPKAGAVQLVRNLRQPELRSNVAIEPAAQWLAQLAA